MVGNLSSEDEDDRGKESEGSDDEDYPMHRPSKITGRSKFIVKKMKSLESGQGEMRANPHASVESLTAKISHRPRNK